MNINLSHVKIQIRKSPQNNDKSINQGAQNNMRQIGKTTEKIAVQIFVNL